MQQPTIRAHCPRCDTTTPQTVMGSAKHPFVRPQTQCQRCGSIYTYDADEDRAKLLTVLKEARL